MRGVNKVIALGTLGQDPELRETNNGTSVCTFSMAVNERWKDKNTGEQKESTEWLKIVLWQRLAEIAGEYLHKGSQVYIEGKLQTRKWQDGNGNDRYTTEIVGSELQMLGGANRQSNSHQPAQDSHQPAQDSHQSGPSVDDDDIPF